MKYSLNNVKIYILASFAAIIISFALLFPALPRLNSSFIGDGGDNYEYASYMMLFKKNISEGNYPLEFTNFWRYPIGFDFERSFDSHLTVILGGSLNYFISSPLSYNLTIIVLMTLNGIFSFIFFRYLTGSKSLALLGMIMYGFSFYALAKAEAHLNLLFIGGFPLLGYSILRIIKELRIDLTKSFLFFFSLFFIALGSKEYFLLAIFFLTIYLGVASIFYKNAVASIIRKVKNSYKLVFASVLAFLVSLTVVFLPYIFAIVNGKFYLSQRGGTLFNATPSLADYLIPNGYLNLLSNTVKSHSVVSIESIVFIGWVELLIFVLFFINRNIKTRFKLFVLTLFLIPFILSLGYGKQNLFPLLPYRFLKDFFIFKAVAETGRYFVVFYLILSSAVVLALIPFKPNKQTLTVAVIFIITILLLERTPLKIMTVATLNDNYTKIVQKELSTAVLDLPINIYYPDYNVLSFYYNKPLVNGYFHWSSDGPKEREFINSSGLTDYSCNGQDKISTNNDRQIIKNLKTYGITTIVIHKDDKFYHTVCKNVRIRLSRMIPNTVIVNETKQQKEIVSKSFTGYPKLILYFPQKGKFNLDGLYVAPDSKANFNILVNDSPMNTTYSWDNVGSPNAIEINPKNQIEVNVEKGSTITIYSGNLVENTYFSVWYRYVASDSNFMPYKPLIERIYQDEKVDVLRLN